jgi:hypothetical protein
MNRKECERKRSWPNLNVLYRNLCLGAVMETSRIVSRDGRDLNPGPTDCSYSPHTSRLSQVHACHAETSPLRSDVFIITCGRLHHTQAQTSETQRRYSLFQKSSPKRQAQTRPTEITVNLCLCFIKQSVINANGGGCPVSRPGRLIPGVKAQVSTGQKSRRVPQLT